MAGVVPAFVCPPHTGSYSIYLIHLYVIGVTGKVAKLHVDLHTWPGLDATCAVSGAVCLCGYACHVRIEKPVVRRLFGSALGTQSMKIAKISYALSMLMAAAGLAAASAAHASDGTITITGNVIASTCKVSNGAGGNVPVTLPKVGTNTLAEAGSVADRTPFSVMLEGCTTSGENPTEVGLVFESGSNVNQSTGRLTLDGGEGAAKNVEINVLNDKQSPVKVGAMGDQNSQLVDIAADGKATLKYFAPLLNSEWVVSSGFLHNKTK